VLFLQDLLPHRLSNGVVADIIAKDYPGQTFWSSGSGSSALLFWVLNFFAQIFWFFKGSVAKSVF
jgi:hypothetical protein